MSVFFNIYKWYLYRGMECIYTETGLTFNIEFINVRIPLKNKNLFSYMICES